MVLIDDLVSIVVPVYNSEKYIENCVNSIIAQTYVNIEVLLVDDGSQDNSYEICKQYQNNDNRFVVLKKENGGAASARKYGYSNAHGEFIVFIDSDDVLASTYIEELYNNIKDTNADMSICSYYVRNGDSEYEWKIKHSKKVYNRDSFLQELIIPNIYSFDSDNSYVPSFLWMRLMKTELVTDLCFYSDREVCTEDALFIAEYLKNCNCVSVLDRPLYFYYIHSNSITHKHRENRIQMELQRIQCLRSILQFYGEIDETRLMLSAFKGVCGCINNAVYSLDYQSFKYEVSEMLSLREVTVILSNTQFRYLSRSERLRYIGCKMKSYRLLFYIETKMSNI